MQNHTNQIHDFNPGFGNPVNQAGDRTFWTVAITNESADADPGEGTAVMSVSNLAIEDYFNLANALADGHSVEATVSFNVSWGPPVTRTVTVSDPATQFSGRFQENQAAVSWSASEDGFTFVSDPASTSTTVFAEVGRERNGAFFDSGDDQNDHAQAEDKGGHAAASMDVVALLTRGASNADAASSRVFIGQQARPVALPAPEPTSEGRALAGAQTVLTGARPLRALPTQVLDSVFANLEGGATGDALRANALVSAL